MKKLHKVIKEGEFIHILNEDGSKLATTDKSLFYSKCNHCGKSRTFLDKCNDCKKEGGTHGQLPQIPQDFIKYFVEKQGNVEKVWCEYENYTENSFIEACENDFKGNYKLKLTKDNEVIISLEEKSYTRDEMIAFGQKCGTAGTMAERIGGDFNHLFLQLVELNL